MIRLDYQSGVPIYQQIVEHIVELVMLGAYDAESQLPSVRSLAVELGINPNTIQKAYQELESKGVIYSVTGKGSFVRGVEPARAVLRGRVLETLETSVREARLAQIPKMEILEIVEQEYEVKQND